MPAGAFAAQAAKVLDFDTDTATDDVVLFGVALPKAGGAVAGGTSTDPLRTDPTGTTTQPVSAASLPLPTGAATAALQTQPGVDIGDVTVNNAAGASAVNVQDGGNILTVDGSVSITGALPAGAANIGDVDVLTVPAPLSTTGGGTEATALRVTLASDSTGLVSVDDAAGSLTVDAPVGTPLAARLSDGAAFLTTAGGRLSVDGSGATQPVSGTVTVTATDLDVRNLDVAQDDVRVGGMAAADAAVADNPVTMGGRASNAVPTAVSADGSEKCWLTVFHMTSIEMVTETPHDEEKTHRTWHWPERDE